LLRLCCRTALLEWIMPAAAGRRPGCPITAIPVLSAGTV